MMDFDDLDEEEEAAEEKKREEDEAASKERQRQAEEAAKEAAAKLAERVSQGGWAPIPEDVWSTFPKLADAGRPKTMKEFKAVEKELAAGEYWGLEFPFTPAMLKEWGPEWLTKALHTTGVLPKDNKITKFLSMDVKAEDVMKQDGENAKWGGAGIKILLDVEYANGPGDLTTGMFCKMPHEFTGKNERFKNSVTSFGMDWSEVTFYNVFGGRFGALPFKVPKMYFCDMCRRTTNFINIVEKIPYAKTGTKEVKNGEYFPAPEKYKDWALPNNGIDLYYAHARALAQFFGWHRLTRESTDQVEKIFMDEGGMQFKEGIFQVVRDAGPYNSPERDALITYMLTKDPNMMGAAATMGFPAHGAQGFLDMCTDFVTTAAPQAFPKELVSGKGFDRFKSEASELAKYCCEMQFFMNAIPEYFSICHPNAQVDNAFYWRDDSGEIQCGLLDWGGVSLGNIPNCIGNGWIGAEPEIFQEHEEKLVKLFVDEFERATGFRFDCEDLLIGVKLAQAAVFYGCCANVRWLLSIFKRDEWKTIKGRKDPKIDENFILRCYFVQIHLWLKMWGLKNSPYNYFKKWQERMKLPSK